MISSEQLSDLFVEIADTLTDDFDLVEFLADLTEHAAAVSGADAVGLMLADQRGNAHYMASSNDVGRALEEAQVELAEGPCLDCLRTQTPVVNVDLEQAVTAWPRFAARAREAGIRSVHAFPMRLRDETIGALNLFQSGVATFTAAEERVVQSLADVATIAILQERAIARAEALTEQLQGALNSRIVIEQAKGALARTEGVSVDEAFNRLRARARKERRRLVDVAADVLARG